MAEQDSILRAPARSETEMRSDPNMNNGGIFLQQCSAAWVEERGSQKLESIRSLNFTRWTSRRKNKSKIRELTWRAMGSVLQRGESWIAKGDNEEKNKVISTTSKNRYGPGMRVRGLGVQTCPQRDIPGLDTKHETWEVPKGSLGSKWLRGRWGGVKEG